MNTMHDRSIYDLFNRPGITLPKFPVSFINAIMASLQNLILDVRLLIYAFAADVDDSSAGQWIVAAKLGDLQALKALEEHVRARKWKHESSQHFEMESFLDQNLWKTLRICQNLARGGYLNGLIWARSKGCPWNSLTFAAAVEGGHMHVLLWLRQKQCPWDASVCTTAARSGRSDILKWLRQQSCPWDIYTTIAAADIGHLELLLWLREQGCPWNEIMVHRAAARGGHWKMIQSLKQEALDVSARNYYFRSR